jgi:hypothetical protein
MKENTNRQHSPPEHTRPSNFRHCPPYQRRWKMDALFGNITSVKGTMDRIHRVALCLHRELTKHTVPQSDERMDDESLHEPSRIR